MSFESYLPYDSLGVPFDSKWLHVNIEFATGLYVIYSILIGISIGFLCANSLLFWNRPARNSLSWMFFLASSSSLVVFGYLCLATLKSRLITLGPIICFRLNIDKCDVVLRDEERADNSGLLPSQVAQVALVLISDATVGFRVGILTRSTFARFLFALLWLVCLVTGITIGVLDARSVRLNRDHMYLSFHARALSRISSHIFLGSSILSNMMATAALARLLWLHRRSLDSALGREENLCRGRTLSQKVLRAIIGSGLAYCTFQAIYLSILCCLRRNLSKKRFICLIVLEVLYTGFSALYPAVILIVARLHQVFWDERENALLQLNDPQLQHPE